MFFLEEKQKIENDLKKSDRETECSSQKRKVLVNDIQKMNEKSKGETSIAGLNKNGNGNSLGSAGL